MAQILFKNVIPLKNIYLHLPFCSKKCHFCSFAVHAGPPTTDYLTALIKQLKVSKQHSTFSGLETIYLGGGTPSLYSPQQLKSLLTEVQTLSSISDQTEITLQMNPSELPLLSSFTEVGFNRISLGIQTFDQQNLHIMNRQSFSREYVTQQILRQRPRNLSVDFILELMTDQNQMLRFIQEVSPEHITIYLLEINQGSYLHKNQAQFLQSKYNTLKNQDVQQNKLKANKEKKRNIVSHKNISLNESDERYLAAASALIKLGYDHYEVSSFTKKHESKHNNVYWSGNREYAAFGMGAASLISGQRITRPPTLSKYYKYVDALPQSHLHCQFHDESHSRAAFQALVLSQIRTKQGIYWKNIQNCIASITPFQPLKQFLLQVIFSIQGEKQGIISIDSIHSSISLNGSNGFLFADQVAFRIIFAFEQYFLKTTKN